MNKREQHIIHVREWQKRNSEKVAEYQKRYNDKKRARLKRRRDLTCKYFDYTQKELDEVSKFFSPDEMELYVRYNQQMLTYAELLGEFDDITLYRICLIIKQIKIKMKEVVEGNEAI